MLEWRALIKAKEDLGYFDAGEANEALETGLVARKKLRDRTIENQP